MFLICLDKATVWIIRSLMCAGIVLSFKIEFKEARNSFHFPQTSFTNSFPNTVWFIVSV